MKKILAAVVCVLAVFAVQAEVLDINGSFEKINAKTKRPANWYFNNWQLYKPQPKVDLIAGAEGESKVLHISDIQGKRGTELYYSKPFPAVAGDTITIQAQVKGKGTAIFGIQFRDDKNAYMSYTKRNGSRKLSEDWQSVKATFKVADVKKGPTKNIYVTFSANHGDELFIRNLTAEHTPAAQPAAESK